MVQGGLVKLAVACLCALGLLIAAAPAGAATYFGATISGETYGHADGSHAPEDGVAWDLFERHAGKRVAILHQGQGWLDFDKASMDMTRARGAIPSVTMGLGAGVTLGSIAAGSHDAAIEKWAQAAKAWGHPFLFAPWWEMNGNWYPWGRSPDFIAAWRRFHDLVEAEGATNVTWTWVVNSIWSADPASDPTPYYPGDAYVDWMGLDSYNWGLNLAQPDKWTSPEQTFAPTLEVLRQLAPAKPVAIIETAASEYGGNKTEWIDELLTTYLPHHPEIKAFLWFNWNFSKEGKRFDWQIETSTPAQQQFREGIQGSAYAAAPVSLPLLAKVPPPQAAAADPVQPLDLSPAAEMSEGADVAVAPDGTATVVWSARAGGPGTEFAVFARRIAPDGARGPVQRLSASDQDALTPRVAVAPDGIATVVWARSDGSDLRVQARRIAPDGTPEEATRTLSGAGQDALAPQVALAPDGQATVVWKRFNGSHYLVQASQIAPDGTPVGSSQPLSEPKQNAVEPQVTVAPDGTATIVWSRFDGADSIVQERRVGADGTLEEAVESLSAAGESAVEPRVAVDSEGAVTVAWSRFNGASWIVQGQRIATGGAPEGSVQNLSAAGRNAAEPQLAIDSEGAATIVWDRFDGNSFVVQARRLDSSGIPDGATVDLSGTGRDAADPQISLAPDGTATVLWTRFDGSNWVVQRRDLGADGGLGGTQTLSAGGRSAGDPALAWGGGEALVMVWKRFAGSGDVIQTQVVPKPPPPPPPPDPEVDPGPGPGSSPGPGPQEEVNPPGDSLRIAGIRLNRKRGTATLTVVVPGPGWLMLEGAVFRRRSISGAGKATLQVIPKAAKRRALRRTGRARVRLTITFVAPTGAASSRELSLRLKKAPSRG